MIDKFATKINLSVGAMPRNRSKDRNILSERLKTLNLSGYDKDKSINQLLKELDDKDILEALFPVPKVIFD